MCRYDFFKLLLTTSVEDSVERGGGFSWLTDFDHVENVFMEVGELDEYKVGSPTHVEVPYGVSMEH